MSENSGPAGRGKSKNTSKPKSSPSPSPSPSPTQGLAPKKIDAETAKENRRLIPKMDPETARETRRLFRDVKKTPSPTPDPDPYIDRGKKKVIVKDPPDDGGVTPTPVTPTPPQLSPVEVLDPNVYTVYREEIKRLTLKLVNRAKNLLLAYDFSSIDRISDYQIETDSSARNSNIITTPQVPQSPSSSTLTAQDTAVSLINAISNQISDNVPMATKLGLFGSDINGTFTAGRLGISNGIANYDLRFVVNNVSPEIRNIIVRCYEIG
jgi:hypothetical protein